MSDLIPEGRPLPDVSELTRPFWTGAKDGHLMMQKCGSCGTLNFLPKPWCIECGCRDLPWVEVSGEGIVYSYTIAHTVMMNYPDWKSDLPIILCIIDIEAGARLYGQLIDCPVEQVKISMPVKAYFENIDDEFGIPKFIPAE